MEEITKIIISCIIGGFILGWYFRQFHIPEEEQGKLKLLITREGKE